MLALQLQLPLLFMTLQTTASLDAGLSAYELASYSVPLDCGDLCDPKFNHFAIHKTTGDIYLGGSNSLVHLNHSYQEIKSVSTFIECTDDVDREDCINHNKVLIIHYGTDNEKLITCGNFDSGACQTRDLSNISSSKLVDQMVAAPGNHSTVYTIAPAPDSTSNGVGEMLYVGATDSNVQTIPLFARRRLIDDPDLILTNPRENQLTLNTVLLVDFKDVFDLNGFTYFVTNQLFDTGDTTVLSKINRVCHDSTDLESRTEVVIECRNNGENYNLIQAVHLTTVGSALANSLGIPTNEQVLIGLFAKGLTETGRQEPTDFMADNRSALCIFGVNDIEAKFVRAIAACYESSDGAGTTGYITTSNCAVSLNPTSAMEFAEKNQCKAASYAFPSGRLDEPILSTAIIEWPSTLVSSIITTIEEEHTIAFIGTSAGQLMKYHLRGEGTSRLYETLNLGSPVLLDDHLQMTEDGQQYLTVLTEQKLFKLRVENCGYYTTCEDCIGVTNEDGDPNCGWCSLTRTCTRKSACDMPDESTRWLSYNNIQCLGISSVAPYDSQPRTVQQAITVTVEQLPDLAATKNYECVFEYEDTPYSSSSVATKSGNDLTCMTPDTGRLPEIPDGKDHITMLLSIRSTETTVKFADTNHTFFECATHERCLDCARSVWDCVWCLYGNKCTHDKNSCTDDTDSTLIAGMEHHDPHPSRQGELECAQLEMSTVEVLVAVGPEREIDITVANLPDTTRVPVDSYLCVLNIEGIDVEVPAVRNGDIVRCVQTNHNFTANIQELNATLTLIWMWGGTPRTIDDEFGFQVTLFKCKVDRPDCSRCVSGITTREELLCGWCSSSQLCAVEDDPNCAGPWLRESGNENCPIPVITSMWPPSGPIEGNTLIEINGTDLGRGFGSIKSVVVAERPCMFMDKEDTYEMSERLFCITSSSAVVTGDVLITVNGLDGTDQTNMAGTSFTYKDPQIQEFSPVLGPEAGGTKVKIRGTSLVAGRYMEILIGGANCSLESDADDDTEVTCFTGSAMSGDKGPVIMTYDGAERTSQDQDEYEYKDNPNIYRVQPNEAFKAGGRVLQVTGINVDVVQKPEVRISIGGKTYTETCKVTNDNATQMECPSPEVDLPARKRRQAADDAGVIATLGFNMDGVTGLRTWSDDPKNNFTFEYFEDPNYFPFYQMVYVDSDSQDISIDGERLNLASTESDVQVLVGNYTCELVSLGTDVLTCTVILPAGLNDTCVSTNVTVNATIYQGNLAFENIGEVEIICGKPPIQPITKLPIGIIAGIAAVAFILLVLIIILTILFRYREKRAKEQTLKLLHEMEKLEESMAGKIRDAFAQLQLDLQDLTSDLEGTGMPFVTNEKYATNMLFSGINSKPSTKDPIDLDDRKERAMSEFCKLLEDKNFLLTFIRVLDEPRSAPQPVIRERTKFACFLTTLMIVEDKLPYLTDVMLTLLKGYIEEAVEEDKIFQLCQRTETVGERLLTNWVSICLFNYLKDQAAFPLFVLYRAVLLQTEKGPVDIVNGKAHYSLSEHFVLTVDGLEFTTMTLNVVVSDDGESKPLKVTNLDTISQVKEKILDLIYRNKPYSQRPDVSLVDLEWRQGRAGRLVLRDNDNTTETDEEFLKLNTLDHYRVPDNASMALVVKQNIPNGSIGADVLRHSIFVRSDDDEDNDEDAPVNTRNPRVSLFSSRARARFTVYDLDVSMDDPNQGLKIYHLEKEEDEDFEIGDRKSWGRAKNRLSRRVSAAIKQRQTSLKKIHYPQLLTTKGATQQYVNNMFDAVLDIDHIPKTIKYVFDFLEAEARTHNITESEILHKWKSSCLPLRFWVTIINNPQYVFDVRESRSVTSSLNVVAQAFFDAFNRTDHTHNKETGFNKLLYHRDLEGFQSRVDNYYMAVNDLDEVDTTEIAEELDIISQQFTGIFSRMSTLTQLYHFAKINNDKLVDALEEDQMSSQAKLAYRLEQVASILEGEEV